MATEELRDAAVRDAAERIARVPGHGPETPAEYRALEALWARAFREGRDSRLSLLEIARARSLNQAAAKMALAKIATAVHNATDDLAAGRIPAASLAEDVARYDRATSQIQCCGQWLDYPTPGHPVVCPTCGDTLAVAEGDECHDVDCLMQGCPEHRLHQGGDHTYEQHHAPADHVGPGPCRCDVYQPDAKRTALELLEQLEEVTGGA